MEVNDTMLLSLLIRYVNLTQCFCFPLLTYHSLLLHTMFELSPKQAAEPAMPTVDSARVTVSWNTRAAATPFPQRATIPSPLPAYAKTNLSRALSQLCRRVLAPSRTSSTTPRTFQLVPLAKSFSAIPRSTDGISAPQCHSQVQPVLQLMLL